MSKGCGALFGLGWTAFSSIFVVAGIWVFWTSVQSRTWEKVPCELVKFEIIDEPNTDPPFRPDLLFRYEYEGTPYQSDRLTSADDDRESDYETLVELRQELYGKELDLTCRVNPGDLSQAVLQDSAGDAWFGLVFAGFGGCFMLVGIGLTFTAFGEEKAAKAKTTPATLKSPMAGVLGCGFFGAFAAAGLGILFGVVVPKAFEYFDMRGWVETPAEVVWSRVRSHDSDDGTTYSVDIFYRYEFEGIEYRSNRQSVVGGSSSGRKSKAEVVRNHPAGTAILCYVDPDEPWKAVRERKLGWWALFALFPLPFAAIGLGGLWFAFVKKKNPKGDREPVTTRASRSTSGKSSESGIRLSGGGSTVGKRLLHVVGAIFLAGFWNGITGVFVWQMWQGWSRGEAPWFLTIFLTPFVLIGLGLIIHIFYRIFAIFSPMYRVEFSERHLSPGGHASISWRRAGGGGTPRRLALWLVGREEATYRRGTSTSTATSVFHEEALFETETKMMMPAGRVTVDLPADAVPSFRGTHNKVRWFVILTADVPMRPDVKDEYEIDVKGGRR
ncbi:hypothetical protein Hhel01_01614 [Haloferula helveola]